MPQAANRSTVLALVYLNVVHQICTRPVRPSRVAPTANAASQQAVLLCHWSAHMTANGQEQSCAVLDDVIVAEDMTTAQVMDDAR